MSSRGRLRVPQSHHRAVERLRLIPSSATPILNAIRIGSPSVPSRVYQVPIKPPRGPADLEPSFCSRRPRCSCPSPKQGVPVRVSSLLLLEESAPLWRHCRLSRVDARRCSPRNRPISFRYLMVMSPSVVRILNELLPSPISPTNSSSSVGTVLVSGRLVVTFPSLVRAFSSTPGVFTSVTSISPS